MERSRTRVRTRIIGVASMSAFMMVLGTVLALCATSYNGLWMLGMISYVIGFVQLILWVGRKNERTNERLNK